MNLCFFISFVPSLHTRYFPCRSFKLVDQVGFLTVYRGHRLKMPSQLLAIATLVLAVSASPVVVVRDENPKPAISGLGGFGGFGKGKGSSSSSTGGGLDGNSPPKSPMSIALTFAKPFQISV